MITYQEFKDIFVEKLKNYFPQDGVEREIRVQRRHKVNRDLDSICVTSEVTRKGIQCIPVLYLEDLYMIYYSGTRIEQVLEYAADRLLNYKTPESLTTVQEKLKNWRDNVSAILINRERNEELLTNVPYTPFLDLAAIYKITGESDDRNIHHSMIVTKDMLDAFNISVEELHDIALRNTESKESIVLKTPIPGDKSSTIYMLSFETGVNGATVLLLKKVLQMAREMYDGNYYILPSSVHEVFVVKECKEQIASWKECVQSANENLVAPEDFLSNSIYRYNSENEELEIVEE